MIIYSPSVFEESIILSKELDTFCMKIYDNDILDKIRDEEILIFLYSLEGIRSPKSLYNLILNIKGENLKYIASVCKTDKKFHYGHFFIEKALGKSGLALSYAANMLKNYDIIKDIKNEKYQLDKYNFLCSITQFMGG